LVGTVGGTTEQLAKKTGFQSNAEKHTSGAKAHIVFIRSFAGDESPTYRPNEFFIDAGGSIGLGIHAKSVKIELL
jgi:hypothetical protein